MPLVLQFPMKKASPEKSLERVLKDIWIAFSLLENAPILLGVKDILEHMKFGFINEKNTLTLEYLNE